MQRLISLLIILPALSGCGGIYESAFDCPPKCGTPCKRLSEVNEMIDAESIPEMRSQEMAIYFPGGES